MVLRMIYGLDAEDLPEGSMAIDGFALVKIMNSDNKMAWSMRRTEGIDDYELATLLRVEARRIEEGIMGDFEAADDD
jgi:hypothetical protein